MVLLKAMYEVNASSKNKANHRYRATASLRRPQIKQYTTSNEVGGLQNQQEHPYNLIKYEKLHPTVVSENYSSSGMLII